MFVYVGGYTTPDRRGHGDGINVYRVDTTTSVWHHAQHLPTFENPSFLRIGPGGKTLFAAHGGRSAVSSYSVDPLTGHLRFINQVESGGTNPVDFGLDPTGRQMVVAHYSSGTVALLSVDSDGRLSQPSDIVTLTGTPGPHQAEQKGPLPHGVTPDASGRFFIVPDKGLDRLFVFEIDGTRLKQVSSARATPGAGPRHAAFHPHLPLLFVINELDCTVQSYKWNTADRTLHAHQAASTLPPGCTIPSTGSEIAISADGRTLYSSNRGHDTIARFNIDPTTGTMTW